MEIGHPVCKKLIFVFHNILFPNWAELICFVLSRLQKGYLQDRSESFSVVMKLYLFESEVISTCMDGWLIAFFVLLQTGLNSYVLRSQMRRLCNTEVNHSNLSLSSICLNVKSSPLAWMDG